MQAAVGEKKEDAEEINFAVPATVPRRDRSLNPHFPRTCKRSAKGRYRGHWHLSAGGTCPRTEGDSKSEEGRRGERFDVRSEVRETPGGCAKRRMTSGGRYVVTYMCPAAGPGRLRALRQAKAQERERKGMEGEVVQKEEA